MTSKEIARMAGVSVSTVSIVMNEKPGVSTETRQRILDILDTCGISLVKKENPAAGGFFRFCKIAKHGRIINERHNIFISEYTDGIIEEAKLNNFAVEVSVFSGTELENILKINESQNIPNGCIILATELSPDDIKKFTKLSPPVVFLDAYYEFLAADFVTMDNQKMTFDAVRHLWESGHRKIGMLYAEDCSNFSMRQISFRRALSQLNIPLHEGWMVKIGSTHESSYDDMLDYLKKKHCPLPTAFFACNDMLAIGAIKALQESGCRVPEDVSLIGFDDLPVSSFIDPPLSTMWVPKREIGRVSVRLLLNRINDKQYTNQKCLIGGDLIKRQSIRVFHAANFNRVEGREKKT
jgi:LacI family transcriptional regulator